MWRVFENYLHSEEEDEWEVGSLQVTNLTVEYDSHIAGGVTQSWEFCIVYEASRTETTKNPAYLLYHNIAGSIHSVDEVDRWHACCK